MKYKSNLFPEPIDVNRENILEVLIDLQFRIAGYVNLTYHDILNVEEWYNKYEISMEGYNTWLAECTNMIARVFRCTKKKARFEAGMLGLSYGLKWKDESE